MVKRWVEENPYACQLFFFLWSWKKSVTKLMSYQHCSLVNLEHTVDFVDVYVIIYPKQVAYPWDMFYIDVLLRDLFSKAV